MPYNTILYRTAQCHTTHQTNPAIPLCILPCNTIPYQINHAIQYYSLWYHAMPHHTPNKPCNTIVYHKMLCHIIPNKHCTTIMYLTMQCRTIQSKSFYAIPFYIIPGDACQVIPYNYTILTIPYHTIAFYIIPYHTINFHTLHNTIP